jgi:hypothetical protein
MMTGHIMLFDGDIMDGYDPDLRDALFHASLLSHIHTLLIVGHHDWLHHPLFDWIQVGTHLIFVGNTYDMDNSFE